MTNVQKAYDRVYRSADAKGNLIVQTLATFMPVDESSLFVQDSGVRDIHQCMQGRGDWGLFLVQLSSNGEIAPYLGISDKGGDTSIKVGHTNEPITL
jgi:hypothetical protein